MPLPPQCLYLFLWYSQRLLLPQSLHLLLRRWCSQILLPPQSLQWLRTFVVAEAATAAIFTPAPLLLVLEEAATDTVFTPAPLLLVLAEAAAAAVFAPSLPLVVEGRGLARLLGCRRPWYNLLHHPGHPPISLHPHLTSLALFW